MNKVDKQVKNMLLSYPRLFPCRFEAMAELIRTGEWHAGCLRIPLCLKTPKQTLRDSELELVSAKAQYATGKIEPELRVLYHSFVTRAEQQLHNVKFLVENIDIMAQRDLDLSYRATQGYLLKLHRDQEFKNEHWPINSMPADIDEDWRRAIYLWLDSLLPGTNELFGWDDAKGWRPRVPYKDTFNWVYETRAKYESGRERDGQGAE